MIYVLSKQGQPLMPTNRNGKIRHLLKDGKAKVVNRCPFTIQLLYNSTNYTQDLTLGVDTGSGTIGAAVSTDDGKIVYLSIIEVRNNITDKMTQRRVYRRNRRNRKTRYRKARFLNRKNSIKTNRFSPTMTSKLYSHIKEIEYVKTILPIKQLVLETGIFDTQKLEHPDMNKHWGYQKGPNYGFANTKAKVLNRDEYTCQYCKGKHKDSKLEVHHIHFRSEGGSDEADNLITLCHTCHKDLHKGKIKLDKIGKVKRTLKYATQMNSIRKQLLQYYPDAIETFGYITKTNREQYYLPKEHYYDACIIASNGKVITLSTNVVYIKKSVNKGDYQRTKGVRSEQSLPKGKIYGVKKFDKVQYQGNEYFVKGRMSTGYATLMNIEGVIQKFENPKTVKLERCKRICARTTILIMPIHPRS